MDHKHKVVAIPPPPYKSLLSNVDVDDSDDNSEKDKSDPDSDDMQIKSSLEDLTLDDFSDDDKDEVAHISAASNPPTVDLPARLKGRFRGCELPCWHQTDWTTAALMIVVSQDSETANTFIEGMEVFLDRVQESTPKFVARKASHLRIQSLSAICGNYASDHALITDKKENGWNVILNYEKIEDVPLYLVSAARFIVIHTPLLPATSGPISLFENQLQFNYPFSEAEKSGSSSKWEMDKQTGKWHKIQEPNLSNLPTITSTFDDQTYTHYIPFIMFDRQRLR